MEKPNVFSGLLFLFLLSSCSKDDVSPRGHFTEEDFLGNWEHGNFRELALEGEKGDTVWDVLGYYPTSDYQFKADGEVFLPLFNMRCHWELDGEYLDVSCSGKAKVCVMDKERMVLLYRYSDEDFTYHKYDTLIRTK